MSIEAIAWVYTVDATPQERNVLFVLALHADADGKCWPGLPRVCDLAKMERVPVIRAINRLEEKGIVERIEKGHKGQSTIYQLKGIQLVAKGIPEYTRIINLLINSIKDVNLECTSVYSMPEKSIQDDTQTVGELSPWLDVFFEITKIPETRYNMPKALDAINKARSAGATIEDMRSGYYDVKDNYTIVSPASLLTPTLNAMRKRLTGSKKNGKAPIPEYTPIPADDPLKLEYERLLQEEKAHGK